MKTIRPTAKIAGVLAVLVVLGALTSEAQARGHRGRSHRPSYRSHRVRPAPRMQYKARRVRKHYRPAPVRTYNNYYYYGGTSGYSYCAPRSSVQIQYNRPAARVYSTIGASIYIRIR